MRIGVVGVQGDVSEHVDAVVRAMKEYGKQGEAIAVRAGRARPFRSCS